MQREREVGTYSLSVIIGPRLQFLISESIAFKYLNMDKHPVETAVENSREGQVNLTCYYIWSLSLSDNLQADSITISLFFYTETSDDNLFGSKIY